MYAFLVHICVLMLLYNGCPTHTHTHTHEVMMFERGRTHTRNIEIARGVGAGTFNVK